MIETLKDVGAILGCIVTAITLLGIIIKPIRQWTINQILRVVHHDEYREQLTTHTENINELKDFIRHHCEESSTIFQEIRDSMRKNDAGTMNSLRYQLYEKTEEIFNRGYIKEKERELLTDMHEAYENLRGNSYITDRVKRALGMETKQND